MGSENFAKVGIHTVTKDDGVRNFHHRGFHVQREKYILGYCGIELLGKKLAEGCFAHDRGVDHFPFLQSEAFFEQGGLPIFSYQFDRYGGGLGKEEGFFAAVKIAVGHVGNMGLGIGRPCPHGVRVFLGVFLDGFGHPAVGISFAQYGINRRPENLGVDGTGFLFLLGLRIGRKVG